MVLPSVRENITMNKGAKSLVGGLIRSMYFNFLGSDLLYSPEVQNKYEEVLGGVSLDPMIDGMIVADFNEWIERTIDQAMRDQNCFTEFSEQLRLNMIRKPHPWA